MAEKTKTATRDEVRAALFDAKNKKRESRIIEILGVEVEIRQPTIEQINRMSKLSGKDDDPDSNTFIDILFEYCHVPGTTEKVFETGDRESLGQFPVGPWLGAINKAIEEMTDIDVEKATKN